MVSCLTLSGLPNNTFLMSGQWMSTLLTFFAKPVLLHTTDTNMFSNSTRLLCCSYIIYWNISFVIQKMFQSRPTPKKNRYRKRNCLTTNDFSCIVLSESKGLFINSICRVSIITCKLSMTLNEMCEIPQTYSLEQSHSYSEY